MIRGTIICNLSGSAIPQPEGLVELHDSLLYYSVLAIFGLAWLILGAIRKYVETESPLYQEYFKPGTILELLWTIIPAILLLCISLPLFMDTYLMDGPSDGLYTGQDQYRSIVDSRILIQSFADYGPEADEYLIPDDDFALTDIAKDFVTNNKQRSLSNLYRYDIIHYEPYKLLADYYRDNISGLVHRWLAIERIYELGGDSVQVDLGKRVDFIRDKYRRDYNVDIYNYKSKASWISQVSSVLADEHDFVKSSGSMGKSVIISGFENELLRITRGMHREALEMILNKDCMLPENVILNNHLAENYHIKRLNTRHQAFFNIYNTHYSKLSLTELLNLDFPAFNFYEYSYLDYLNQFKHDSSTDVVYFPMLLEDCVSINPIGLELTKDFIMTKYSFYHPQEVEDIFSDSLSMFEEPEPSAEDFFSDSLSMFEEPETEHSAEDFFSDSLSMFEEPETESSVEDR